MIVVRRILAFIAAILVTEVTIALVNAHSVMGRLAELGVEIPLGRRLATYGEDVLGLAGTFVPVLALGFGIAFTVAWATERWLLPGWRRIGYPLAGLVCMAVVLWGLGQIFLTHPVPATRSLGGYLAILACGAAGGAVFLLLGPHREHHGTLERSGA